MIRVAYDGTNYHGWQIQPNGITIESELNRHLSQLLREEIHVTGASRTDSGVHARGNVAVFDTSARMPAEKISYAMNTRLPEDIRIQESREVAADFHPRRCKSVKTYEYKIYNRRFPDPCVRLYSLFYYWDLDLEAMKKAAAFLVGTHDFTSFSTARADVTDRVRTIYELNLSKEGDMITLRIRGNGFLYNMVRIIRAKDRERAGETARPEGLTLLKIEYPELGY